MNTPQQSDNTEEDTVRDLNDSDDEEEAVPFLVDLLAEVEGND